VDQMERVRVAPEEVVAFLEQGKVKPSAGGGQ